MADRFEVAGAQLLSLARAQAARIETMGRRLESQVDGCRVAWRCWGSGPAVVLLHGGSGGWNHWIRNVEAIAAHGFTVLAPDMPGYGDSGDAPQPHGTASLASVMMHGLRNSAARPEALLRQDAPLIIVGFSFGGAVAVQWARQEGRRLAGLVLVGAMGLGGGRDRGVRMQAWKDVEDPQQFLAIQRHNLGALMFHDQRRIDDLALGLHLRNTAMTRFVSKWISRSDEALAVLPELDAPLHGIWGEHDVTAPGGPVQRELSLRSVSPGSGFDIIEEAGHWVQYEQADHFNQRIRAALTRIVQRG
jgi:2-hydroxy-6-oxonona-2,4-dienedioate hydrolase